MIWLTNHVCKFDGDIKIFPDGVNELSPHLFETIEYYKNVDVEVVKCKRCGEVSFRWYRTPETEEIDLDEVNNYV